MNRFILTGVAVLVLTAPAFAQAPRTISYQGILTDNAGVFIADGNYSLTVRLYAASIGGSALYTETQNPVAVAKGGFNILIGTVTPLSLTFDAPMWLSLQVGGDPELAPRVALGSSPYALGLSLPIDARGNGAAAALTVRNSSGPGFASEGPLQVFSPTISTPLVTLQSFSSIGGQIVSRDEVNNAVARIEPDANGTGGFFTVFRSATAAGFTVNGNDGTEEPIVNVTGSARSTVLDMSAAGDASILLPSGAVSALELSNEPGVAEIYANSTVGVGLGITTITSRTITVPDAGFVIVVAGGHMELGHVTGTDSRILYGVNDVNGVFATSEWVAGVPSGAPTGSYRMPLPFTGVWPVSAGANTFFLLAQRIGAASGGVVNDPTLTLIYVPTSYGTVTGNLLGGDTAASRSGSPSLADVDTEKSQASEFDRARIQRELDAVRAQLESIQGRLTNNQSAAIAAPRP